MVVIVVLAFGVLAFGAFVLASSIWRHHRTPVELRGDWWPRFEREFRDYAQRTRR